jgi:hypothetical protein
LLVGYTCKLKKREGEITYTRCCKIVSMFYNGLVYE